MQNPSELKPSDPSISDWFFNIAPSLSRFLEKWFSWFYRPKTN